MHPANLTEKDLLKSCQREHTRASGPGGQHRNRASTAVRITHKPSGIKGQANEKRSQKENSEVALFRLRLNLALKIRTPPNNYNLSQTYQPSKAWKTRLAKKTIKVNEEHKDFPSLLAEVLDVLAWREDDIRKTSEEFLISKSQLIKFLSKSPRALADINQRRKEKSLPALH